MITAGELKHRITIEQSNTVQDENTGEINQQWQVLGTFWGKFIHLSSKEMLQAQAVQSQLSARLTIRHSLKTAQIDTTMRVRFGNQIYNIIGQPIPDHKDGKTWITLELSTG